MTSTEDEKTRVADETRERKWELPKRSFGASKFNDEFIIWKLFMTSTEDVKMEWGEARLVIIWKLLMM